MQLRVYAAFFLFLGSYLPLSMILLVQNVRYDLWERPLCGIESLSECVLPFRQPGVSVSFVAICLICFAFTLLTLSAIKPRQQVNIVEAKHIPTDLMNYVLPYVVSFMGLDYQDTGKFGGFLVFLLWMFWITYKSDRIIMNPVLTVFGWQLFEVKYTSPGGQATVTTILLSKFMIDPGQPYRVGAVQNVQIVKEG